MNAHYPTPMPPPRSCRPRCLPALSKNSYSPHPSWP